MENTKLLPKQDFEGKATYLKTSTSKRIIRTGNAEEENTESSLELVHFNTEQKKKRWLTRVIDFIRDHRILIDIKKK